MDHCAVESPGDPALQKYKQILTVDSVGVLSVQHYYRRQTGGYMTIGDFTLLTICIDSRPSVPTIPDDITDGFLFFRGMSVVDASLLLEANTNDFLTGSMFGR